MVDHVMAVREHLTKTDELLLLGDERGAIKHVLRTVRGARTAALRTLETFDALNRAWPSEASAFDKATEVEALEGVVERMTVAEAALVRRLGELDG